MTPLHELSELVGPWLLAADRYPPYGDDVPPWARLGLPADDWQRLSPDGQGALIDVLRCEKLWHAQQVRAQLTLLSPDSRWPDLSPDALHGPAGDFVRLVAADTEADPAALLVQFLVAFGSAAGRGPHVVVEQTRHGLNEFVLLIGQSSKGRKGTALRHVEAVFAEADPDWTRACRASGLSSGEGLIWAVHDPIRGTRTFRKKNETARTEEVITDAGVGDKRLMVSETEFGGALKVMSREGSSLSALVRQAWDGGNLRSLTKNSPATATAPHVSIIGHVTIQELLAELTASDARNGFLNRFLPVLVRRSQLLPDGGQVDPTALTRLARQVHAALGHARRVGLIGRTPRAGRLWRTIYPILAEARPGYWGAATSRAEAHVFRLSALYAALDGARAVDLPHLAAALAVWSYADASARWVFGDRTGDKLADRILDMRPAPAGLTRTDLSTKLGNHVRAEDITRALALLASHGFGRTTTERPPSGGRPAARWVFTVSSQSLDSRIDTALAEEVAAVEEEVCENDEISPLNDPTAEASLASSGCEFSGETLSPPADPPQAEIDGADLPEDPPW